MSPGLHFKEAMGAPVTNDAYILEWKQIGNAMIVVVLFARARINNGECCRASPLFVQMRWAVIQHF